MKTSAWVRYDDDSGLDKILWDSREERRAWGEGTAENTVKIPIKVIEKEVKEVSQPYEDDYWQTNKDYIIDLIQKDKRI